MREKTIQITNRILTEFEPLNSFALTYANVSNVLYELSKGLNEIHLDLVNFTFISEESEIHYFKAIKPVLDSNIIYYQQVLRIIERLNELSYNDKIPFLEKEMKEILFFFELNREFCRYHFLDATYLDHYYFLRKNLIEDFLIEPGIHILDKRFYARMSYKQSQLLAFTRLKTFLVDTLRDQKEVSEIRKKETNQDETIRWILSKADLGELIIAFHAHGCFGPLKLKTISDFICKSFNIEVGNIYKIKEDNRLRKKNRTPLVDSLKNSLLRQMEHDDEFA